jgi:hypothetical protein
MTVLVLEESQLLNQDEKITDLPLFLKGYPKKGELILILKTHEVSYHLCPTRKALPHLKSIELSKGYWIGEKILPTGRMLISGILPSPFMRQMVQTLAEHAIPLKGIFLWTDLVAQAFGPLPQGWVLLFHENHLMICQEGILCISRLCCLPLVQELPALFRYLKRFGFHEGTPLTILSSEDLMDNLPPSIHLEIRSPGVLTYHGLKVQVPELIPLQHLVFWPQRIRWISSGFTLFALIANIYLGWQIYSLTEKEASLSQHISQLSSHPPVNEEKMEAFAAFRQVARASPLLLSHIRLLIPLLQGEAVVTHLHWTAHPFHLTLHLNLFEDTAADQLLSTFQSHFPNFKVSWQAEANPLLKGILTFD